MSYNTENERMKEFKEDLENLENSLKYLKRIKIKCEISGKLDDRKLFINMFNCLFELLEEIKENRKILEKSNYLQRAVFIESRKRYFELRDLQKSLEERKMI